MQQDDSALDQIRLWLQAVAAIAALVWGLLPTMAQVLIVLQTCDILTGVMVAARRHRISSRRMRLAPKVVVLLMVGLAYYMDAILHLGTAQAVCGWYCMKESLSLVENAGRLGVPVPHRMRRVFEALRDEGEKPS